MNTEQLKEQILQIAESDHNKTVKRIKIQEAFDKYEAALAEEAPENPPVVTITGANQQDDGLKELELLDPPQGPISSDPDDVLGMGQNVVTKK